MYDEKKWMTKSFFPAYPKKGGFNLSSRFLLDQKVEKWELFVRGNSNLSNTSSNLFSVVFIRNVGVYSLLGIGNINS